MCVRERYERETTVGMREGTAASLSGSVMTVCKHRDTQECEREMATTTAPDEGQGPRSGRSCFGDRAGFAQQRARGSCRASHEASACTPARVKSGPETPALDVADPADGQKLG